jgi:hypothetical protein
MLRANNKDEFAMLLDQAYADLGLESPRVRREKRAAEDAVKRAARVEAAEAKRVARIEALKAELAALAPGDPIF